MKKITKIEYEGLESLLTKIVRAWETEHDLPAELGLDVHLTTEPTENGIRFHYGKYRCYIIRPFAIEGPFLQDGTCILVAYDLRPDASNLPIYIDMTEFLGKDEFDIYLLIDKMNIAAK